VAPGTAVEEINVGEPVHLAFFLPLLRAKARNKLFKQKSSYNHMITFILILAVILISFPLRVVLHAVNTHNVIVTAIGFALINCMCVTITDLVRYGKYPSKFRIIVSILLTFLLVGFSPIIDYMAVMVFVHNIVFYSLEWFVNNVSAPLFISKWLGYKINVCLETAIRDWLSSNIYINSQTKTPMGVAKDYTSSPPKIKGVNFMDNKGESVKIKVENSSSPENSPISTPVVAGPSRTPVVAGSSNTPVLAGSSNTPVVAGPSNTPLVAAPSNTTGVAAPSNTTGVAAASNTTVPAGYSVGATRVSNGYYVAPTNPSSRNPYRIAHFLGLNNPQSVNE
jgi:hypothetical protein